MLQWRLEFFHINKNPFKDKTTPLLSHNGDNKSLIQCSLKLLVYDGTLWTAHALKNKVESKALMKRVKSRIFAMQFQVH